MAQTGGFNQRMQAFRKSKIAVPFALIITGVISLLLLFFGGVLFGALFCLMPPLIALMAYGIPTYFGLKNRKKLALFGLVLFVVLGLFLGYMYYTIEKDASNGVASTGDLVLTNGTVSPLRGNDATTYKFSVQYHGTNATPNVFVVVYDFWAADTPTRFNLTVDHSATLANATQFVVNHTVPKSVYRVVFAYEVNPTTAKQTNLIWGPISASNEDILSHELSMNVLAMFLNVAVLFYLLLVLTWWMDSSKKKYEKMQKAKEEDAKKKGGGKSEKFVCSECGSDVPMDAEECPQCGEKFEEEDDRTKGKAKEPVSKSDELICSECGKTVKETDEQCWNCGKKFDN